MSEGSLSNQPDASDVELMAAIAARDDAALRVLYDRYSHLVLAICLRVLHDRSESEDVVVDVFWEVWERGDRFDGQRGSAVTYLSTLARSRAIDRRRSLESRGNRKLESLENTPTAVATDGNPSGDAIAVESQRLVGLALNDLDPNQRQAIECAYYDGLSHSEIATRLNKPLGTIKTYIRTGLLRLKTTLSRRRREDESNT